MLDAAYSSTLPEGGNLRRFPQFVSLEHVRVLAFC